MAKQQGLSPEEQIELELLTLNHQEHFNYAKTLAFALGAQHPKVTKLNHVISNMVERMNLLREKLHGNAHEKSKTGNG